jgi:hypothetical protein
VTSELAGQLNIFDALAEGITTPAEAHRFFPGWRMKDGRLVYQARCPACGWVAPQERDDENSAVEDGLDHAWPGWPNLPAVTRKPWDVPAQVEQQWLAAATDLYPAGWVAAGGPVRTMRPASLARHHFDAALGFWDIGVPPGGRHR